METTRYTHYDLSKPNEAYFERLDHMVHLAAKHHLIAALNPIETVGWMTVLRNNGPKAAYTYGQYLGNRYRIFDNVMWVNGNDFNTWTIPSDDELVQAVAKGIRSAAPEQLQSVELHVRTSSSFDDPRWARLIDLNSTYTYSPTYIQMLHSYDQTPVAPTFLVEGHYDLENVGEPSDLGTPSVLRRQEYWAMLTGGTGEFYGNAYTWSFKDGWKSNLDTIAVTQLGYWSRFFISIAWQDLVPDRDHEILTAGYGSYGSVETRVSQSDYSTAASTPDGSTIVIYIPTRREITVNMARLGGSARAQWFDPSSGQYREIPGGALASSGSRVFRSPGKNRDGDTDWVLLLKSSEPNLH